MNRVRALALVLVLTMMLPIVPLPTAEAEVQRVSFRPEIVYTDVKSTNVLYLQRVIAAGVGGTTDLRPILWTYPPTQDDVLRQDPYAITFQTAGNPTTAPVEKADFSLHTSFRHNVSIVGRNVFSVRLFVSGPASLTYDVQILDRSGTQIASARFNAPATGTGAIEGDLITRTPNNRHTFTGVAGNRDILRLVVVGQQATPVDAQNQAGTWTLSYGNEERASFVRVVTEDAIKVAAWTEDEDKRVTTAFRYDTNPNAKNWIRGFFAVKSAFGFIDFDNSTRTGSVPTGPTDQFDRPRRIDPTAELLRGTEAVSFTDTEGQVTRVGLVRDTEFSAEEEGLMLYRFDPDFDHIDYRNKTAKPSGAYQIRYRMQFRPDDAANQAPSSLSATAHFSIASANLAFSAYPGESLSHQTSPGRTSTFVLLAQNAGDVYDNLTLELSAVPAALPGWGATLGGPGLKSGNRVELPPGAEGLVTVTIQSPGSAKVGDAATYQLRGRSQVDPALQTQPIALIVSLIPETQARPGAGVIAPSGVTSLRAGSTATVPVYLWNKGSGPGDLTMGLLATAAQGWRNQSLVFAGTERTDKVTVEEIQPGNIVEIGVRVSAIRASAPARTYDVEVNATTADVAEPPTAVVRFRQELTAGFLLRMLNGFGGGNTHTVEMNRTTNDPRDIARDKDKDALDGTWFRLWITNVGASDDTYRVEATNYVEEAIDENATDIPQQIGAQHAWGERGVGAGAQENCPTRGCPPLIGYRTQAGEFTDITTPPAVLSNVQVPAGRTKELYVWVAHRFEHDRFPISTYRFNILVSSDVAGSQVIAGSGLGWDACTASQPQEAQRGVYACGTTGYDASPGIEAVSRDPDYDRNHLVDVTLADRRSVTSRIGPTDNVTYRLRVTNGASFGRFLTQNNIEIPSAMNITAKHDKEAGWSVKLRFVGQKGWNESLELFNVPARDALIANTNRPQFPNEFKWKDFDPPSAPATRQSFFDREIEMLVEPPNATSNKRVFAGESHSVLLEGRIRHPVLGAFTDALTVTTVIGHLPNVTLSAPLGRDVYPKAGSEAVAGLFVLNNGSAPANVSLTARVASATGGAGLWTVTPSDTNFVLTPRENRTFALRVRAPLNVPPESTAEVLVIASWRERQDDLSSPLHTAETTFRATVIQAEAITITPSPLAQNAEPRKTINFTITVKNDGQTRSSYRLDTILVPNWTASLAPRLDDIPPNGGTKSASFVMTVPGDIVSGRTNEFVIRVQEVDNPAVPNNVDYAVVTVNIVGGQPIPSLQTNKAQQIVERNGNVRFEFGVRNLGNVDGRFPIALIGPNALGWRATVTDERGSPIDSLLIKANARRTINLTVGAPVDAPERSVQDIELQVLTPDRTGGDRVNVRAIVHDYGLDVKADPPRADLIPGLQAVFNVRVSNLGNDNDTFNLSLDMGPLTDTGWSYEYGQLKVRVPPNEFRDVRLTVRSPKDNLPTPRTATMYAYSASEGASNLSREQLAKLDSTPLLLTVLDYRVGDVDQDGILEVAVDANKRRTDGFELFREISTTGTLSQAIESAQDVVTGHTRFLIDVPVGGSYDGIADVFWDPDASSVTRIQFTADVNQDAAPDYFLDLNADTLVDRVYDSGGRRYLTVEAKDILGRGEDQKQYLVYTDGDRFPDAFYDPVRNEVWKVVPAPSVGENVVGFIPKDKTKPTLYYDVAAERVYQSPLVDSLEFFKEYWYALVTFLGAAIILGVAIARRKPT